MNYLKHYNLLIERGKNRVLEGYVERHHIIPRCLGGSNDVSNLVQLTPEEHYVAHQLLHKMHPNVVGLAYAMAMFQANNHHLSNKIYGWVKRKIAIARTFEPPRKLSEESKIKLGLRMKKTWQKRKAMGESHVIADKIKATRIANGSYNFTEEHKANISKGGMGKVLTKEQRAKLSQALKGKPKTAEHIQKVADAQRGKKRKPLSDEHKEKIKESLIGRVHSPESIAKMGQSQRDRFKDLPPKPIQLPRPLWCEQRRGILHTEEHKSKISDGLKKAYANGRKCALSKLTDNQVREIRQLLLNKTMMQKDIALQFKVSQSAICDIKNGRSYTNII
jgi:hypothetical protein